jgi:hypothetical protein
MEDRLKKLEDFADRTEPRLARIESRLDGIEARMDGIEARMATKEDLKEAMLSQLKWLIGVTLVLLTFFLTSVAFLLDIMKLPAAPSAASAAPPPVVIYLPQPQAQAK